MNASLDACVYIARLRVMPAAIPPAVSRFLSVHSIVSGGSVPFVRALNSAITPVLWNSYGASTMVYPEPTSTAVVDHVSRLGNSVRVSTQATEGYPL